MRAMVRSALAVGVLLVAALAAFAAQEELLTEARKLIAESKPLVERANDVELDMEARRGPRKEAFQKLKKARELYDRYLDVNPSMEEKLDQEYCDCVALLYWIKKDASLGELERETPVPELPAAPGPAPEKPPAGAPPGPGNPPPAPEKPVPADADLPARAKRQFDAIVDYEKKNPGDLPTLLRFYEKFLADFGDPTLPEYAQAVEKLGRINDRMNSILKEVAKRDPTTVGNESRAEEAIFGRLSQDFSAKDPGTRRRAARLMTASRARSAAYFLAKGVTDKDADLAAICREGAIAVGGAAVGEHLVKNYRDAAKEKQQLAIDILNEISKKGPVDALAVSAAIGRFALSNDADAAATAVNLLVRMGRQGAPGLLVALDSKIVDKKVTAMDALAQIRYYRSATRIGGFLVTGDGQALETLRAAAMRNLKAMGKPAVPYMIPLLSSASRQYAALVMREITGELIGMNDPKKWRQWCEDHAEECRDPDAKK